VTAPVFFDPTGKRRRVVNRSTTVVGLALAVLTTIFVVSLLAVPFFPQLPVMGGSVQRLRRVGQALLPPRQTRLSRQLLRRSRLALWKQAATDRSARIARGAAATPAVPPDTIIGAFYVVWQRGGVEALNLNASHLTDLFPEWLHLSRTGNALDFKDWDPAINLMNAHVVDVARSHHVDIQPVFNNAEYGQFDSLRAHELLSSPANQRAVVRAVVDWLRAEKFQGLNLDFENLKDEDYARLPEFVARLRDALHPAGLQLSVDVEVGQPNVRLAQLADLADFVILMAYNQHSQVGPPGPIAAVGWYDSVLTRALAKVPASKVVVGVANYGLDWRRDGSPARRLSFEDAMFTARDNRPDEPPQQIVDFDPVALNPTFTYRDDSSRGHEVWMLDAATAYNDLVLARRAGVKGAALWVLGAEDPTVWSLYDRRTPDSLPKTAVLDTVPTPYAPVNTGEGDVLEVVSAPRGGRRTTDADSTTGLVTDEQYESFPMPYVIKRSGYQPKKLVLTFDDGPDALYTPEILDELKELGVPATFFLVGQNVERYPDITRRIVREGYEIGSHTFTHPNMATVSHRRAILEFNATQRALQSVVGRSTILFRFPYNADEEASTNSETDPIVLASSLGYITVGELIDPQDWNLTKIDSTGARVQRTADDIVNDIIQQADTTKGNVILLHSAGGDRSQTVYALGTVVPRLQAKGYEFVTVARLLGTTRDVIMPPVGPQDQFLVGLDRVSFNTLYAFETFLSVTFLVAVGLAILRVAFVVSVALVARHRAKGTVFDPAFHPSVTVLVAAYNERSVIAHTIRSALANEYPGLEVIVVDDGSTDGTGDEVETHFAGEQRVRLIRQANAGKAAALNRGLHEARGEILVCFDADTQITPRGIHLIVRHFADPAVGAVAGNVKVGNRINILTRWQSIEYITSQNLDRRAYAYLNAMTVVPGAVGAWRKSAVLAVGGYQRDTMAEDMELTYRLRRAGWRITADPETLGFTEAPATFRMFFRQRFRWAYGTLQCLWKHRGVLCRYGWFGWLAVPTVWLFQVFFLALGPLVDLKFLWTTGDFLYSWATMGALVGDWNPLPGILRLLLVVGFLYGIFFAVDLIGAFIAYRLDREDPRDLWWLFWQRFVYRQMMYAVLWKSLVTAVKGKRQAWGKVDRKGTVQVVQSAA
jgi:cellulose synthase/poly-beta-1,6-N-acetylglucosamine synthase-like glycosyltransferase/spore germination protein YaaH/peptidoglycan/xylan/chitin deacetylase (PgdA/CDA1 family)